MTLWPTANLSNDGVHVVPGDTLNLTIKGKIADVSKVGTREGVTSLLICRPAPSRVLAANYDWPTIGSSSVSAVFEPGAEISFDVTPQFRHGVYIDSDGRYWMRRPDGWHKMSVEPEHIPNMHGSQFAPRGAQRLKEDK